MIKIKVIAIAIGLIAIMLFVFSFYLRCICEWGSNTMTSIAGGMITGLVLYILSNARNTQQKICMKDYDDLVEIRDKAHELRIDIKHYLKYRSTYLEEIDGVTFVKQSFTRAEEIEDLIYKIRPNLYNELEKYETETEWFNLDSTKKKYDSIVDLDDGQDRVQQLFLEMSDKLNEIEKRMQAVIVKKRDLLTKLNKPL